MTGGLDEKYSVSVVIPAYNAGGYIGRAIESVLAQTRAADEVIVVDDGSKDDTARIVAEYGSKIVFIRQENAGPSAARNAGIRAARSEWVAFLDADDEWLPEKLSRQLELLKRNPHLKWTTGNFNRCLCSENRSGPDLTERKCTKALAGREYFDDYLAALLNGFTGCTDTKVVRRDLLLQAGLFRIGQKRFNDLDLWLRVAYLEPQLGFDPQPLSIYHLGIASSVSQTFTQSELYCDLVRRHLVLAQEHNRLQAFRRFAAWQLRRWMRAMFFDGQEKDVRQILSEFQNLLPGWYRTVMYFLTIKPQWTAKGCLTISKFIRTFNIRRQILRRPSRQK